MGHVVVEFFMVFCDRWSGGGGGGGGLSCALVVTYSLNTRTSTNCVIIRYVLRAKRLCDSQNRVLRTEKIKSKPDRNINCQLNKQRTRERARAPTKTMTVSRDETGTDRGGPANGCDGGGETALPDRFRRSSSLAAAPRPCMWWGTAAATATAAAMVQQHCRRDRLHGFGS